MFHRASKRVRRSRRQTFELLESRLCLSAGGAVAFPDWGWNLAETSSPASNVAAVNQAITTDSTTQQSPSIDVDPLDSSHLVMAYMDFAQGNDSAGIGISVSRNGGRSWQTSSIALPEEFSLGIADPIVKFDSNGYVFVSWTSYEGFGPQGFVPFRGNTGIFVARSDDGGLTWKSPIAVTSYIYDGVTKVPLVDLPDLAVDNVRTLPNGLANPNFGNLYVTWTLFYPSGQFPGEPNATGGSDVQIAVSRDSGLTWQTRMQTDPSTSIATTVLQTAKNSGAGLNEHNGFLLRSHVAVGATGDVSVADFAGAWFYVNHSDDAGEKFFVPSRDPLDARTGGFPGLPFGPGPKLLNGGLSNESLITVPMRAIVADPVRPGHIYVAEPLPVLDSLGNALDAADIAFARSEDYGRTWSTVILPNASRPLIVNDDNGNRQANGKPTDVTADQFMVRMQVNAKGDVGLVWYDARRDPENHRLDVFGAISTNGGRTFSPNFRVTDQSFDPDVVKSNDGSTYLGSAIGLAMTDDMAYIAWTDTRVGNKDIFFRSIPLQPPPAPLNDRFEPNDGVDAATDLGQFAGRSLPRLALDEGDTDWFQMQSLATGAFTVTALTTSDPNLISLQILDGAGQQVVAESTVLRNADGKATGRQAIVSSLTGQPFAIRISSSGTAVSYALEATSLTADLGPLVFRTITGSVQQADQAYYLFEATASGSVSATPMPATDDVRIDFLDASTLLPLKQTDQIDGQVNVAVKAGQKLLLRVTAADNSELGATNQYGIQLANLDQYSSAAQPVLHFPAGVGPSQMAVGDFNGDGITDVAVTNTGTNTVSVMLGNGSMRKGDGTFSAPQQYSVGAFRVPNPLGEDAHLNTYRRDILAADFNNDGHLDLVVTNYDSADVSVLLGRANGTFEPQRRFDAAAFPIGLTAGYVDGDKKLDLLVVDSKEVNKKNKLAVLLGRDSGQGNVQSDGIFQPQRIRELPNELFLAVIALGDLDNDGVLDLVVGGGINDGLDIFRGIGDGSFEFSSHAAGSRQSTSLVIVDLDGDGNRDVVATALSELNSVTLFFGSGNLGFQETQVIENVGQGPIAVKVKFRNDEFANGRPLVDLIVANSGVIPGPFKRIGSPSVVLLPGLPIDAGGRLRFGDPILLATAEQPLDLDIADFDSDDHPDIAVVDRDGFFVIYANPPNIAPNMTQATARDLGTVLHTVQPSLTIVPGHEESWFSMKVASEVIANSVDQVLDFSAGFAHVTGAGLQMEVVDLSGRQRGVGDRFRIRAQQGETLFVHIFSLPDAAGQSGAGTYTLVIDTLPQLATVEAPVLLPGQGSLPGGPTTSLVLVFQGDRLDPTTAQNPNNYRVTWLGPDARLGGGDDRPFVVGAGLKSSQPVVYSPSGNRDVASGHSEPSAVRQTVTLQFADALPAGSYLIEVLPQVKAASFNTEEQGLLSQRAGFTGHRVVSLAASQIEEGASRTVNNLVSASGAFGDFSAFRTGTRFLTQLHADLGAVLDDILSVSGDVVQRNTQDLLTLIVGRLSPAISSIGESQVTLLALLLDPVSISLVDPNGKSFSYDLRANTLANHLSNSFVEVGGNVELVVIAQPPGIFQLNIANVPPLARGGWVYLSSNGETVQKQLTADMRARISTFRVGVENQNPISSARILIPLSFAPSSILSNFARVANATISASFVAAKLNFGENVSTRRAAEFSPVDRSELTLDRWDQLRKLWLGQLERLLENAMRMAKNMAAGTGLRPLDEFGWLNLRQAISSVLNDLAAKVETLNLPAAKPRDQPDGRNSNTDGRPDNNARGSATDQAKFNSTRIRSTFSRNPRSTHESARIRIDEAGTVASVPTDTGANADRSQAASEDRRVGHRATDDHRSTPRVESVSRGK